MIRLKIRDKFYKLIDGYDISESSREVKFSNLKLDFTNKTIADLPLKYQECNLVEGEFETVEASEGLTIEGTSFQIDYDTRRKFDYYLKGNTSQSGTPTPDSQQVVNTITGRQEIRVYNDLNDITYELNLGKNLFNPVYEVETQYGSNGQVLTGRYTLSDGIISIDKSNNDYGVSYLNKIWLNAGTYTWSFNASQTGNTTSQGRMRIRDWTNSSDIALSTVNISTNRITKTFTLATRSQISLMFVPNLNSDGTLHLSNIQLEAGNGSDYKPYKTPIELCKIGNYQDRIFKNTPDSDFYDNTLEENAWYLHKEINKAVLDDPTVLAINGTSSGASNISSDGAFTIILANNGITNVANEDMYTNAFTYLKANITNNATANTMTNNTFCLRQGTNDRIYFRATTLIGKTGTQIRDMLKPLSIYYVTTAPTTELIEDTELLGQLEVVNLLEGVNNISISSSYLPAIMNLHYNFNEEYEYSRIDNIIYTGYVNSFVLPKMKNRVEYRELELELLSPLAMATLRTADAVGTYNLQALIRELVQPLLSDGFTLKEMNVGDNQITVNILSETIESALNKLSNKFNFWWYIDKNKNIYINNIEYLIAKTPKLVYDDNNKIDGLIDVIPSIDATDYCNVVDFTDVRLFTHSRIDRRIGIDPETSEEYVYYTDYNPIMSQKEINPGDEIEFDIPFDISLSNYLKVKDTFSTGTIFTDMLFFIAYYNENNIGVANYDYISYENNQINITSNISIDDSYSDDNKFVLVRDPFFNNLIVGLKYNGTQKIIIEGLQVINALMLTKIRIIDNNEVYKNKGIISKTGIVEKQVDMNEQWKFHNEIIDIANSYIKKNTSKVEQVKLNLDKNINVNIGDTIKINKLCFLIDDIYVITDKKVTYDNNVMQWSLTLKNANILESYVDLFRAKEQEETDKEYHLITSNYSEDTIKEAYEVVEL